MRSGTGLGMPPGGTQGAWFRVPLRRGVPAPPRPGIKPLRGSPAHRRAYLMTVSQEVLQHKLIQELLHPLLSPQLVLLAPGEKRRAEERPRHGNNGERGG